MAFQNGLLQLTGRVGDVIYYKSKRGFEVRSRGGVTRERILNDPAYASVRQQMSEFKHAQRASKVFRTVLRTASQVARDGTMSTRMTNTMLEALKGDIASPLGSRKVMEGNFQLLQGFEFNKNVCLSEIVFAGYKSSFDRVTGEASVEVSAMVPRQRLIAPINATHFRFGVAGAEIDMDTVDTTDVMEYSDVKPIDSTALPLTKITAAVKPNSTLPVVVCFAVEFFKEVNGVEYQILSKSFNACMLTIISKP